MGNRDRKTYSNTATAPNAAAATVALTGIVKAAPEWYSWPADYDISPDEEWIIRDQKTGSGENALFLYHFTRDGQLWRLSTSVDDVVFTTLLGPLHRTRKDYYHLEVTFVSWDLPAGGVHLKAYAVPEDKKDKLIEGQKIRYDLKTHVATPE